MGPTPMAGGARDAGTAVRALLALALAATLGSSAAAQPRVHVLGRARLELRLDRGASPPVLHGVLRDDLGEALAGRDVDLVVETRSGRRVLRRPATTDDDGALALPLALGPRQYVVRAAFEGDANHAAERVAAPLDLSRADVRLRILLADAEDGELDLDATAHRVRVEARSDAGPAGLPIELVDERDRELASGVTDSNGEVLFEVPSATLAVPGAGRLRAKTPGDAERAASQTELPVVRVRRPRLSMDTPAQVRAGEAFVVTGRLVDGTGPLRERAVGLYLAAPDPQHLGTVLTGADGRYRLSPTLEELGRQTLEARFASDGPGRPEARSPSSTLQVSGPGELRWAWSLAPIALGLAIFALLRRRPAEGPPRAPAPAETTAMAGVVPGRRRARRRRRIDGRVVGTSQEPLAARLLVQTADGATVAALESGPDGSFEATLAAGQFALRVEAADHAPLRVPLAIPHRGAFTGITLRLQPVREAALDALAVAVVPAIGAAVFRQRTVHALALEPALSKETQELAQEVEAAVYGPVAPAPEHVERLGDRARALRPKSAPESPPAR